MNIRYCLTLLGAASLLLGTVTAAEPASEFTTTDPKKCKLISEGAYSFKYRCPGMGGYGVVFEGSHGRSWITLDYDGETIDMMDAALNACPGEFPAKANDVIQWRGYRKGGKFMPYAMIYRMKSSVEGKPIETLVVVQLAGSGSKVIGGVPSNKGGNEAAEKLADKECGHLVDP